MSLFKSIREMDQRFSWSFLGFMAAILLGSVTLYNEFYKENKPDLNFIITSNSSVLDIRENLGSLDVLYHGESLSKNKKDLRLITFEVANQGNTAILSNFYDPNDPVGFTIIDGKIADEPVLIEASNTYLKEKLVIDKQSESSVLFSNVIIEPLEYFRIKVLVLHDMSKNPTIKAFGKIADVNNIDVFMDYTSGEKRSFFEESFGGGFYQNLARLFFYGIAFVIVFVFIIISSEAVGSYREKNRKNKLVRIFKEYDSDKVSGKDSFFFDYYLSKNAGVVNKIHDLLQNQNRLIELSRKDKTTLKYRDMRFGFDDYDLFTELLGEGFIKIENNVVSVDDERLIVLTNFVSFLKRKGEFKDHLRYERMMKHYREDHRVSLKVDTDEADIS